MIDPSSLRRRSNRNESTGNEVDLKMTQLHAITFRYVGSAFLCISSSCMFILEYKSHNGIVWTGLMEHGSNTRSLLIK